MAEMSKIEEVARALCRQEGEDPDLSTPYHPTVKHLWEHYIPSARATIEAMRKPTPQMLAAGWAEITTAKKVAGIARLGPGPGLSDGYRAMIDAALSEEVAG